MFILASASPRRKQLLKQLIDNFEIIVSHADENIICDDPTLLPKELSKIKAEAVFNDHPNDIILASDTIVLLNGEVLGKPKDKDEAIAMLHKLSGNKHLVITGYTIMSKDYIITKSVTSEVYFNALDDELITRYVETESPLDKAGAYGIQDHDFPLVNHIEGSYSNVMGLPLEDLKITLEQITKAS